MDQKKITLFNYDKKNNKYFTTLIEHKDYVLTPDFKTKFTPGSTVGTNIALLIISYKIDQNGPYISQTSGVKYFEEPKRWRKLENDLKSSKFTFQSSLDFFAQGDYSDRQDIVYQEIKNENDKVFMIHEIIDYDKVIKHWEIEGY
jgi:hypothetical protein